MWSQQATWSKRHRTELTSTQHQPARPSSPPSHQERRHRSRKLTNWMSSINWSSATKKVWLKPSPSWSAATSPMPSSRRPTAVTTKASTTSPYLKWWNRPLTAPTNHPRTTCWSNCSRSSTTPSTFARRSASTWSWCNQTWHEWPCTCRRPSRYCTVHTYFCTVRWYFLVRPTKVRRKTCERARPPSQASEMSGYGRYDPRMDPMSVRSHVHSFPGGIIRKVRAIPEGIPCPLNPMSVRSQKESYGRLRQS